MLALRGIADEIVGIDYNKRKEWGEIQDLSDMLPYLAHRLRSEAEAMRILQTQISRF